MMKLIHAFFNMDTNAGELRQHRIMGAAGFGGSFAPIVQYEKWEIHKVFPHFPYFRLGQNLALNLLAPLCGIALSDNDGTVLTIDCHEVENYYDITNGQMADLDWLLYNAPMEYASLALSGEMENYLKGPALHGIED